MKIAKHCKVEVKKDHLNKVASGSAKTGLAELIWNALDADANNISVNFIEGEFGTERVVIQDDGTGISYSHAEELFVSLGGSWKSGKQRTASGRFLHGKEGEGRFKAFSLGRVVDWNVTYKEDDKYYGYTIEGRADSLDEFLLSDVEEVDKKHTGVKVEVDELDKRFHVIQPEMALDILAPIFALYLSNYKPVTLRVNGEKIDPKKLIKNRKTYKLTPVQHENKEIPAELEIVEWNGLTEKDLWFCDLQGFPLEQFTKQIRGVSEFGFTAYLKSEHFRKLHNDGLLSLRELETSINSLCDEAVLKIKDYFFHRSLEEAKDQLDEWKVEEIYPFKGEPATAVEEAERKVFDIVAINVSQNLPDFKVSGKKTKQFQLSMLKHAIEKSPQDLQKILTEVINLPKGARENLAELLEDTSLNSIINASKIVSDRIHFVTGLEHLLFNYKEHLKERSQLHRLLAKNTWMFGDAFALSVDDKSLTEVLRQHVKTQGIDIVVNEPVKRIDKRKGIVDLMLSRQIPRNHEDELEHLVVELKRPDVVIGKKELDQIESYAFAVADDERFIGLKTKWDFWIISNKYDSFAEHKLADDRYSDGVIYQSSSKIDITIRVKTWSQLIRENKHRLEFIKNKLNYNIDSEHALDKLKKTYSEFLEGITFSHEVESAEDAGVPSGVGPR